MKINHIELKNFRNYKDCSVDFDPFINIFIGKNAQGKTNLLEAIYILSLSKSFKTKVIEEFIYFNEDFASLPQSIQDELHIMCVLYTEEIGGILTLEFDEEGNLQFQVESLEADAMFDEIGSVLKIKDLQNKKKELLESLELYYRVFFLGEEVEE